MTITNIERQRHNSERFSIFIDSEFAFGMSGVDVLYYKLEAGMELSPQRYEFLTDEVLFAKAREYAYNYLEYRPRTRREVADKLDEYPAAVVDKVLGMLEKHGYINDYDFAKDYTETRTRTKGYGKRRLEHELKEKGVEHGIIKEVLSDLDFDETAAAVDKLERKAKGAVIEEHEKRRYFDYLARQGYSYDVIKQAFREYELGV